MTHLGGKPMKTYMANPDKIERKWYVVDAAGCTLGRLTSEVAKILKIGRASCRERVCTDV